MSEQNNGKNNNSPGGTKKLALSAVFTAISGAMIIITNFTPLTFALLMIAAFCYFQAFDKCGIALGFITMGASILISFFTSPLSGAFFLTVIAVMPYSVLAFLLRKLRYTHTKELVFRVSAVLAFASALFTAIYFLAESVFKLNIGNVIGMIGWAWFGAIFILLFLGFDLVFNQCCIRFNKLVKL